VGAVWGRCRVALGLSHGRMRRGGLVPVCAAVLDMRRRWQVADLDIVIEARVLPQRPLQSRRFTLVWRCCCTTYVGHAARARPPRSPRPLMVLPSLPAFAMPGRGALDGAVLGRKPSLAQVDALGRHRCPHSPAAAHAHPHDHTHVNRHKCKQA
jgi:hypothetical protein